MNLAKEGGGLVALVVGVVDNASRELDDDTEHDNQTDRLVRAVEMGVLEGDKVSSGGVSEITRVSWQCVLWGV